MSDLVNISVVDLDSLNSSVSLNPYPNCEYGSGMDSGTLESGSNPDLQP
jgi:hypothetical protein